MTEQELRKKYEEGAKNYVETHKDGEVRRMYGHHFRSFLAGAEHAHSEGKKEGWNEALDKAIIMVENNGDYTVEDGKVYISEESVIEELKKLKR